MFVIDGHAIEVRVVAEDPSVGWLPSTGTVSVVRDRRRRPGRHADSAPVRSCRRTTTRCWPRSIAHAPTRTQAAHTLARALRSSQVAGVRTNIEAMANVLLEPDFLAAATPTAYLDEHPATMVRGRIEAADDDVAPTVGRRGAAAGRRVRPGAGRPRRSIRCSGSLRPVGAICGRRASASAGSTHERRRASTSSSLFSGRDRAVVMLGPWPHPDRGRLDVADDREPRRRPAARSHADASGGRGRRDPFAVDVRIEPSGTTSTPPSWWSPQPAPVPDRSSGRRCSTCTTPTSGGGGPISPLPGTVIAVHVSVGDTVAEGSC